MVTNQEVVTHRRKPPERPVPLSFLLSLVCKDNGTTITPILMILTDEGDGGSPSNRKSQVYVEYLKQKYDLDAVIIETYGPYMSRMNPVERAIAIVNRILSGENDILAKCSGGSERSRFKAALVMMRDAISVSKYCLVPIVCDYVVPGFDEKADSLQVDDCPQIKEVFNTMGSTKERNVVEKLCSIHKLSIAGNGPHLFL